MKNLNDVKNMLKSLDDEESLEITQSVTISKKEYEELLTFKRSHLTSEKPSNN